MEPRSLQCVFLGYSNQHKCYRCLFPPTGRVYISRLVVFDEDTLLYTARYKNFVPKYEPPLLKTWQTEQPTRENRTEDQIARALPPPAPPTAPPTAVPEPDSVTAMVPPDPGNCSTESSSSSER